jgi:dTDP-4-amino-4,6-dideoxygalactose transaminase
MRKLDHVIGRRVENHLIYQSRFADTDFHHQRNDRAVISSIAFAVLASSAQCREKIAMILDQRGIETRPIGGGNMSRQPFWARKYGTSELPAADRIHAAGFQLPNHPRLTATDINDICDAVLSVAG